MKAVFHVGHVRSFKTRATGRSTKSYRLYSFKLMSVFFLQLVYILEEINKSHIHDKFYHNLNPLACVQFPSYLCTDVVICYLHVRFICNYSSIAKNLEKASQMSEIMLIQEIVLYLNQVKTYASYILTTGDNSQRCFYILLQIQNTN